jgi:hypothetical protein
MSGLLAMVAYRCLVEGSPTGSLDFQVRWFQSTNPNEVRASLIAEPFHRYSNPVGEAVSWELVDVLAIEPFDPSECGSEVVGFIASAKELARMAS